MTRRLAPAALILAALLGLAGCGQATEAPEATAADDPVGGGVSGSSGSADPDTPVQYPSQSPSQSAVQPQWPSIGCESRSVVSVDYGRMPTGFDTPEEAVENSPAVGLPAGELSMAQAPYTGKGPAQVWIVDPVTDEIQAQVSVFRGPDGWFVDGVMTCS